jgi:ribosomal protein S19E (S16A)
MKSLQNQYNLIKEGKGNKEIFLKEAKTQFPQYITNVQTFDQVIHSLTEKGIINESMVLVSANRPETPDWFKVFKENTESVKADLKDTDKSVTEKETAGYDYEDKNNSNNISTQEILNGYYAEMKDPKNADKTETEIKATVFKNLEKDPLFYIKNAAFGVKGIGYTEEAPGLGKTKEVTGKYKSSGMEPVNLNEAKKRAIEKHIKEIEKMGEVAAWDHRIGMIQEKIEELTSKMTMTEGDDIKEMVDKKAVKELKKDIALLEKRKALYEKQKAKAAKRVKDKSIMQTAAGEGTTVMEKEEKPVPSSEELEKEWEERKPHFMKSMKAQVAGPKATKKESWSGMVRELINKKNLKVK